MMLVSICSLSLTLKLVQRYRLFLDGYSKGDDVAERCTELGLVLSDVEGWLQEPPFPPARQVSNPYREVVWKLGRDLTQRGFSRKEAGKLVNASGSTMKRWLGQDCYHEPALPTGRPTGNTIFDRHPTAFPLVESLARQVRADEELDMPASELLALSFTAITGEAVTASTIRKKFVKDGAGLGILRLPSPHPVAVSYLNSKSNTDDEFHQAKKEMDEAIQRELNSPSFIPDPDFELL